MDVRTKFDSVVNFSAWQGAIDTIETIKRVGKIVELDAHLECVFENGCTETQLNDYLWFESQSIYESLGLDENGDLIPTQDDMIYYINDNIGIETLPLFEEYIDFDEFESEDDSNSDRTNENGSIAYVSENDTFGYVTEEFKDFLQWEVRYNMNEGDIKTLYSMLN